MEYQNGQISEGWAPLYSSGLELLFPTCGFATQHPKVEDDNDYFLQDGKSLQRFSRRLWYVPSLVEFTAYDTKR